VYILAEGSGQRIAPEADAAAGGHGLGRFQDSFVILAGRLIPSSRKLWLYQFDDGLVTHEGDAAPVPRRWDEVAAVQIETTLHRNYGNYSHTTFRYTLTFTDGVAYPVDGLYQDPQHNPRAHAQTDGARFTAFARALSQRIALALLPGAQASLAEGRNLTFGSIVINAQGVQRKRVTVPWAAIREISLKDGYLTIKQDGRMRAIAVETVGTIPNLPLLLTLTDQLWRPAKAAAHGAHR
jgi:uncharacterized protein DUF6585